MGRKGARSSSRTLRPAVDDFGPTNLIAYGGTLIFSASDGQRTEIWSSDGTQDGTARVTDTGSTYGLLPSGFAELNGVLYFRAFKEGAGYELWRTDGTGDGTRLVRDIRPGSASSDPSDLINVNGTLFFTANDGTNGIELWRSDGTEAGTMLVRNINPAGNSYPAELSNFNGALVFVADNGINGRELWRSDGTAAGTMQVRNIQAINAVTYSLVVKVNAGTLPGTVLSHTASVSSTTPPDPVPGNNSVTTTTTVVAFNAQRNTSFFPITLPRTVRFQVNDGAATGNLSNVLTRAITITALNDTPRVISIEPKGPGSSRLTFGGIAGRSYTIEFTGTLDPDDWQPLATSQADAQGVFEFLDTPPPGTTRRFYRARFP